MPSILMPKTRRLTKAAERAIYQLSLDYRDATPSTSNNVRIGVGMQAGALQMRLREIALATGQMPTGVIDVPRSPYGTGPYSIDIDDLPRRAAERRALIAAKAVTE
jgi:hypothetical protein